MALDELKATWRPQHWALLICLALLMATRVATPARLADAGTAAVLAGFFAWAQWQGGRPRLRTGAATVYVAFAALCVGFMFYMLAR